MVTMDKDLIISAVQTLASGEPDATVTHLRYGSENQRIILLQGAWADVTDMFDDAERFRKKYSLQHLVVAPFELMTRDQMMTVALPLIATRLNFPACEAVVVEHEKARSDPDAFPTHWHIVIEHFDPVTGKVRDWWKNRFKQELIARILEHRLGHQFLVGFYHDAVLDTLRREFAEDPDSNLGAVADALEAAHPRGSRPQGSTVPKSLIRMHEAVGRDLVALRKACNAAWRASADLDQFNAALAPHGLYAQLAPNPPPAWAIYDNDGMIGTVAGMAKAKKADVIAKLGDPADDDWYRTYALEPEAPELGAHHQTAGADAAGDPHPHGVAEAVHQLAHFEHGHNDAEAERVFEAEMNALPASRLNWCESMANWLTRSPWAYATAYFDDRARQAKDYLAHGAANDFPAVFTLLTWIRAKTDKIKASLAAATTAKEREKWTEEMKIQEKFAGPHEQQYLDLVAKHRSGIVATRIAQANRYLRVTERCAALINDDRGANILGLVDPEVMFEMAYNADKTARPGARWKIAGPDIETPDFDDPDGPTGPSGP